MLIAEINTYYINRVIFPDAQIEPLSRQLLSTTLDGNESRDLHTSLRLSVHEGVRDMYRQYRSRKWQQVSWYSLFPLPTESVVVGMFSVSYWSPERLINRKVSTSFC